MKSRALVSTAIAIVGVGLIGAMPAQGRARCTVKGTRNGDLALVGTDSRDVICAKAGADNVVARAGRDLVRAGRGDDKVEGSDGADILKGNRGADVLEGNLGKDRVKGGTGNDRIVTADAVRGNDKAVGGKGKDDTCVIDKGDRTRGCETVRVRL